MVATSQSPVPPSSARSVGNGAASRQTLRLWFPGSPRKALLAAASAVLAGFAIWWIWLYPVQTVVKWNEEIGVSDATIVAEVTSTYQRRQRTLNLFDPENLRLVRKDIAFDSAPGHRVVFSTHEDVTFLGRYGNEWFAVLYGDSQRNWPDAPRDLWGKDFSRSNHRLAKLKGEHFEPVRWEEAPAGLQQENMLRSTFYQPEFGRWQGRTVSLADKDAFRARHPIPGMYEIARPLRLGP
jgi:hypothetical protein